MHTKRMDATKVQCIEYLRKALEGDDAGQYSISVVEDDFVRLITTNAELMDVVRDCVNFLADLNTTAPFDAQDMTDRAKALHKRAYTAHSKAKEG